RRARHSSQCRARDRSPGTKSLLSIDQGEGPHRSALGDVPELLAIHDLPKAAETGKHRNVLLAVARPRDRLRVDARAGLELPERLAGLGVDGDELAGHLAGEKGAASRGEAARPLRA